MNQENTSFLKFLIDEEIYILNEEKSQPVDKETDREVPNTPQGLNYKERSVFFLDYTGLSSIPGELLELLKKILKAVNLDIYNVELVFRGQYEQIDTDSFESCTVIGFLDPVPSNLTPLFNAPAYQVRAEGNNRFLRCDKLEVIHKNTTLKRQLWGKMKVLYTLS